MKPMTACKRILKRSGSSFALAFNFLPPEQRDAMTAFYAFCRESDDAVDNATEKTTARNAILAWKDHIELIYQGRPSHPIALALQDAVSRFGIRREHLELALYGMEQDIDVQRQKSFSDLYEYCYQVASSVGLVIITVLGDTSSEAKLYAELTGIAVQLTNILRDIDEDADAGRIYLPLEDLQTFGVRQEDILKRRMTKQLKKLLRFEGQRAMHFYDMASAALPPGTRHRLFFAEALRETYLRLLNRLINEDFPVFEKRVSIGSYEKLLIGIKHRSHPATFWRA